MKTDYEEANALLLHTEIIERLTKVESHKKSIKNGTQIENENKNAN